jgi:hypothetical protein
MKSFPHICRRAGFALIGIGVAGAVLAQTTNLVNDGTSAANLTLLMNRFGTAGATWSLTPEAGALRAEQSAAYPDFPVNAVWYAPGVRPVSAAYAVLADVRPASANPENVPGVMGWLDPEQGRGIVFRVVPGAFGAFQVAVIDFNAPTAETNDSTAGLFHPDGTAAQPFLGSAWSGLGEYDPGEFVTLELAFAPPTAADRAAVSNVTARVTARAYQGSGGPPVGEPIELLTTLPVPPQPRVGYAAKLDTLFLPGGVIGHLKNLRVVGDIEVVNQPPVVALTSPADGTRFTVAPASVTLEATASDPDGGVARVEFLRDGTVVGTATTPPYRLLITGLPDGQYVFAARAVDNQGATTTSAPARVTVADVPPTLVLSSPADGAVFAAPAQIELQAEVNNPGGQSLERVEFLQNETVVGQALAAPYRMTLSGVGPGNHVFQARLVFGGGRTVSSAPVTVTVTGVSQPPRLVEPTALPPGGPFQEFQFTARNLAGGTYQIEATTNFTAWTVVASGSITGATQVFRVPRSTTSNRQFFRLVVSGGGGGGVTPARLTGPRPRPSAAQFTEFEFTATELTGSRYQVEASSNLKDWSVVETGSVSGATRVFTFPRDPGAPARFYRVVSLP